MVVNELTSSKRKYDSATIARYNNLHERIQNELGCVFQRCENERQMVPKISNSSVAKEPAPNNSQSEHGQLNSCLIYQPQGRNPLHGTCTILLTLELWDWCMHADISHCSRQNEQSGGQRIEGIPGRDRLEIRSPSNRTISVRMQDTSFSTRLTHQLKRYISWRPDPEALNYDALSVNWSGLGDMPSPLSTRYLQS